MSSSSVVVAATAAAVAVFILAVAVLEVADGLPQDAHGEASNSAYDAGQENALQQDKTPPGMETSTWDKCECGNGIMCVCVMYYLCDPYTNTTYTYGENVLDERFQSDKVDRCPGCLQRCCRVPGDVDVSALSAANSGRSLKIDAGGASRVGVVVRPPLQRTSRRPIHPYVPDPEPLPVTDTSLILEPVPVCKLDPNRAIFGQSQSTQSPSNSPGGPDISGSGGDPTSHVDPNGRSDGPHQWECGIRRTDFKLLDVWARISDRDDEEVAFGEFPWTLVLFTVNGSVWLGGASLVRPDVALTAAHVVQLLEPNDIVVRAGEWDASTTDEPLPHQDRGVERVLLHPGFVRKALWNDIALLFLDAPFEASAHVAPICLPPPVSQPPTAQGRRCIATGWGAEAYGKGPLRHLLRSVELPVVPRDECQRRLRSTRLGIFYRLHDSFMCAGAEGGRDTCKGDGGGPLVCQSEDDPRRYEQVGIVSWGIGCASPDIPAVYTDVGHLRQWLDLELISNS